MGLYANLADYRPRASAIRVQISAAPCFDSERRERVRIHGTCANSSYIADSQLTTQSQASLAQQTAQLAKEMNLHAPYLNAWKVVADAITNPEKRAKAKKAIEALSQRKLNDFEDSDTRSEAQNRYKSGSHEE